MKQPLKMLPEANFLYERTSFNQLISVTILNLKQQEFFKIGYDYLMQDKNDGRYIKVWPSNVPNISSKTLDKVMISSLELLESRGNWTFDKPKSRVEPNFTYIKFGQESPRHRSISFYDALDNVLGFVERKTEPSEFVERAFYDHPKAEKLLRLQELCVANPDLFPDYIKLLPKKMRLQAKRNRTAPDQNREIAFISENEIRGERGFYFNNDAIPSETTEYNPNNDWYLDKTIDDIMEKKRNNYQDFGPDEPSEFKELELDDYIINYREEEFTPMNDKAVNKLYHMLSNGRNDIFTPKNSQIKQSLPKLLRNHPSIG